MSKVDDNKNKKDVKKTPKKKSAKKPAQKKSQPKKKNNSTQKKKKVEVLNIPEKKEEKPVVPRLVMQVPKDEGAVERKRKKKLPKFLAIVGGVAVVAVGVYFLLDYEVKKLNAPVFSVELEKIPVCPNGKVLDFEYKVEDKRGNDITESAKVEFKNGRVYLSATDERGFYGEKAISALVEDKDAPEIELNGDEEIDVVEEGEYDEEGATAVDKCDGEVEVKISGSVDTNKIGEYEISYKAVDGSGNEAEAKRIVNVNEPIGTIYLTFDDGPGDETDRLLDVLKKYNVKATFFVTGRGDDETILREYEEGHAVGLHSYTHRYDIIYRSVGAFFDDLYEIQDRVERITGHKSYLMRFPGGGSNTVSALYDGGSHIMSTLVDEVEDRGFSYFDWNISSGDAGGAKTAEEVYDNVTDRLGEGRWVVLQHDIAGFSVDAVENIIKYGKSHGFKFDKLSTDSFGAHHPVYN